MNAVQEKHKIKHDLSTLNIQFNSLKQAVLTSSVPLSFFFYYYTILKLVLTAGHLQQGP